MSAALTFALLLAPAAGPPPDDPVRRAELAGLLRDAVRSAVPKQVEDLKEWNQSTPVPPRFALTRLRRTVTVGDRVELAHGTWRRNRVWLDDPARDVHLEVPRLARPDGQTTRLRIVTTVSGHGERERQQWQKGLCLLAVTAVADATVTVTLDCDVTVVVRAERFPPQVKVGVTVTDLRLDLDRFNLRRVGPVPGALLLEVEGELKAHVAGLLRGHEAKVKAFANEQLAKVFQGSRP